MDWLHLSGGAPSLIVPLGTYYNNQYYISDQCLLCLEDLIRQLNCDDINTHARRLGLGYVDILNKIVGWITTPTRSLIFNSNPDQRKNSSYVTYELEQLLYKAKEIFRDGSATRAIIDHAKHLLSKQPLSRDDIEFLNLSLLLIRNILDAPEHPVEPDYQHFSFSPSYNNELDDYSQQNEIVCNLFAQGFGVLLLEMLSSLACPEKDQWVMTIVQLVAAIYKGRSVEKIQAQLRKMTQSSINVSFDDDETTDPSWHPDVELQPSCHVLLQTFSATAGSSSSSTGTASDTEQKISSQQQRWKTYTRKLGVTFSKEISEQHAISQLLAKFTIDFMLNGFSILLKQLLQQLQRQSSNHLLDKSHFLWLLVNFLPLASQLGQKAKFMKEVLTTDVMCYLVWAVVQETEAVQLNFMDAAVDPKPNQQRLHLGIRAIFEYLQALEKYSLVGETDGTENRVYSQCDEEWVIQLRHNFLAMNELRQLFALQLRHFDIEVESHQRLCDIICANHTLLLTLERAVQQSVHIANFHLDHHLSEFCTSAIIARYGSALAEFRTNDHIVNESIFAMLRRVGFDLGRLDLVCQPVILRPLCKIWEEGFEICNDWHDLIERLVRQFTENLFGDCDMVLSWSSNRGSPDGESFQLMEYDQQLDNTLAEKFASIHNPFMETYGELESLIRRLTITGYKKQLGWIQSSLLVACATRLGTYAGQEFRYPVSCSCMAMKIPCPMVPWTELEACGLRSEHFRCLLQQMGLIPHSAQFFLYPKIPSAWSADILYSFALLFGTVDDSVFDLTLVKKVNLPICPNF